MANKAGLITDSLSWNDIKGLICDNRNISYIYKKNYSWRHRIVEDSRVESKGIDTSIPFLAPLAKESKTAIREFWNPMKRFALPRLLLQLCKCFVSKKFVFWVNIRDLLVDDEEGDISPGIERWFLRPERHVFASLASHLFNHEYDFSSSNYSKVRTRFELLDAQSIFCLTSGLFYVDEYLIVWW